MASHLIDYPCGCYISVPDDPIDAIVNSVVLMFCEQHAKTVGSKGAHFKKDIL